METFDLILLVLSVVLVSAVLDQLLTRLALPLVQIMIGALLASVVGEPLHISTSPELFLVLFIAPLLFDESRKINKQMFVRNLGSILSLAIGLVLVSALAIGFALNWLAPTIPLAGAFALGAMLGPTDAAAVTALSRSLELNTRQKSLLSGEALIRVDLDGEDAELAEDWPMGERIRAVAEAPDGAIWLLEDGSGGRLLELRPA